MSPGAKRATLRWIHIIFALPLLGYVYGPPEEVLPYRDNFRLIFVPVVILTGFWMWKGDALRRLVSQRSPRA